MPPDDEKPMWHSHKFEVKGGVLFMPAVPGAVERRDLEKVAKTYGKIVHFWQVDRGDALPLGLPQVMMALTREGQLRQDLAECKLAHQGGPDGARPAAGRQASAAHQSVSATPCTCTGGVLLSDLVCSC
jgi:hypothetical protein